jgi:hypothetical protein
MRDKDYWGGRKAKNVICATKLRLEYLKKPDSSTQILGKSTRLSDLFEEMAS